jgi:hypothetical protein
MNSAIFWDITPCSPLKFNRRFGRTFLLHLQGRRISQARKQPEKKDGYIFLRNVELTTRRYIPEDGTVYSIYLVVGVLLHNLILVFRFRERCTAPRPAHLINRQRRERTGVFISTSRGHTGSCRIYFQKVLPTQKS